MRSSRSATPMVIACYAVLLVGSALAVFPYLLVILTAFKGPGQLFSTLPWEPGVPPSVDAFDRLFAAGFGRYLANTVMVTVAITVIQLVCSVMAAYAFARIRFPGREALFWVYLSTLMVPPVVTMIPLYLIMQRLGLIDSWAALILPTELGSPYAIFLLRQFFRSIPVELEDTARIDGAGRFRVLLSIVLPLSRPILITVATLAVVGSWNSLLWPLIITSSQNKRVLSVGIALFKGEIGVDYNALMAGSLVALLPLLIVFVFCQRFIVRSVAVTGSR